MAKPPLSSPLTYFIRGQYEVQNNAHKQLLRERLNVARNLYRKDLLAHYGCVNAIEFSNKGELLASGGDDRRVLIWNVEHAIQGIGKPVALRAQHNSNIFCLGFDSTNSKIFSAGNDDMVIVHDLKTGLGLDTFQHDQPVYGLSIDPLNDNVFASACDDGRVLIYDIRSSVDTEPTCLANYQTAAFHAVMFNPVEPRMVATANSKEGVGLWDVRKPLQPLVRYGGQNASQSCMSVRFNQAGTHILALRRRLPPVLYGVDSAQHICQFDHPGYYNSCTMKSCCFAGDNDEYVLSGSDDFNLYMWKIPPYDDDLKDQWVGAAHMILQGHRSIVNQVRFNPANYIIASSGVEKLIKFWSPFPLPKSGGSISEEKEVPEKQRKVFSHEEYIRLVLLNGQFMSHDYSHQSTKEDPRMMAFFDSLVQREIEGWSSEDSSDLSGLDFSTLRHEPLSDSDTQLSGDSEYNHSSLVPSSFVNAPNRISELISRKRAQLMRLAGARKQGNDGELPLTSSLRHVIRKKRNKKSRTRTSSKKSKGKWRNSSDNRNNSGVDSEDENKRWYSSNDNSSDTPTNKDGDEENSDAVVLKMSTSDCTGVNGKASSSGAGNSSGSTESKKRSLVYFLKSLHSDSSDDDDWRPSQKRKKLRRKSSQKVESSDTDDQQESSNVISESPSASRTTETITKWKYRKLSGPSHSLSRSKDLIYSNSDSEPENINRYKRKNGFLKSKSGFKNGNRTSKSAVAKNGLYKEVVVNEGSNKSDDVPNHNGALVLNEKNGLNASDSSCDITVPGTSGERHTADVKTPDSGIAIACSSSDTRPSSSNGSHHGDNPDLGKTSEWVVFKKFKSKADRARRNLRKRIEYSDSD